MPRSKSIPGSKPSAIPATKEQSVTGDVVKTPEQNAVRGEVAPARVAPQATAAPEVNPSPAAKVMREPRKLEVVKSDVRKNLVPINLDDEIRKRAFELYQQRGAGGGSEAEDWLRAEREVRQRYRQQSA